MLQLIIRKEVISHILSLRFTVTFMLFLVLIFTSIYVTVNDYRLEVDRHSSRVRTYKQELDDILAEKDDWGAHGRLVQLFYDKGIRQSVPVAKLAWLNHGLQSVFPAAVCATAGSSANINRGLTRNPLLGLLSAPDFVYVVNVVLSLLAVLFMFDAICGEKRAGTLRLMLSNSVPRHTVLLGKWLGGYVVLLVPFLIATAAGLGYAWAIGVLTPTSDVVLRIAILVALAAFYIAVFFNLSLFISTTTSNAATSLLVSLLVWVVFILAIPNLAPVTAKILVPTPAPRKIQAEKAAVSREIDLKMARLTATSGELSYGKTVEDAKDKLNLEREKRHREWDKFYEDARRRQGDLSQTLGRLSPSASWIYTAASLTGTGPESYRRLEQSVNRFAKSLATFRDGFFKAGKPSGSGNWPEIQVDDLPILALTAPTIRDAMNESLNDVLLLTIFNVVFFMLAFVFFLRYDVR